MRSRRGFDLAKALETILYVAERTTDMYHILKVMYFADKEHLSKYGRLMSGDSYIAMRAGPVPSGAYDIIKCARGDGTFVADETITEALSLEGYRVVPLRGANLELLSESELECLDSAIETYGDVSFNKLMQLSHDDAFRAADQNDFISLEEIVKTLPDAELLMEHLLGD